MQLANPALDGSSKAQAASAIGVASDNRPSRLQRTNHFLIVGEFQRPVYRIKVVAVGGRAGDRQVLLDVGAHHEVLKAVATASSHLPNPLEHLAELAGVDLRGATLTVQQRGQVADALQARKRLVVEVERPHIPAELFPVLL